MAVAAFWLANRATGSWLPYDTGYYHASTLEWFAQYPVVPGLANLHGPLAAQFGEPTSGGGGGSGFLVSSIASCDVRNLDRDGPGVACR